MSTQSPAPFPENGRRALSAQETMQRVAAIACTEPQGRRPACVGQIYVGMFFDGTGNNMKLDYDLPPPEQRRHTNVVKLYQAHRDVPREGYMAYYMPGVGTPFPEIGDTGGTRGSATGAGGEARILWALQQLVNAPHRFVTGALLIENADAAERCDTLSGSTNPAAMRRVALRAWQESLTAQLKKHPKPKVTQINLSVFGFSRGAAEARVFVNWLFEACEQAGGGWRFAGIPIRLTFLGIFDTVASVGAANLMDDGVLAGHQSWADNTLEIHPAVEQCVHYVAGHEVRACFPLDSVRVKASYPPNAVEVMYPGSHSDVGGGYAPGSLGVSPRQDDAISILPGRNMYDEAFKAGVPLLAFDALKSEFKDALTPTASTIQAFNAYLRDAAIGSGPVEEVGRRHMTHYFNYRYQIREQFGAHAPAAQASTKRQADDAYSDRTALQMTQTAFLQRIGFGFTQGHAPTANAPRYVQPRREDAPATPQEAAALHRSMLKAADLKPSYADKVAYEIVERMSRARLTPAIAHFCGHYVHDSMAGFINFGMNEYAYNKLGLAKFRAVFKGND